MQTVYYYCNPYIWLFLVWFRGWSAKARSHYTCYWCLRVKIVRHSVRSSMMPKCCLTTIIASSSRSKLLVGYPQNHAFPLHLPHMESQSTSKRSPSVRPRQIDKKSIWLCPRCTLEYSYFALDIEISLGIPTRQATFSLCKIVFCPTIKRGFLWNPPTHSYSFYVQIILL